LIQSKFIEKRIAFSNVQQTHICGILGIAALTSLTLQFDLFIFKNVPLD